MATAEKDLRRDLDEGQDDTPASVAADCLSRAEGDWKRAALIMQDRVRQDRQLRDAVLEPFMREAIWYFIRQSAHAKRKTFRVGSATAGSDSTSGIGRVSARNWYEYPLPGGKPLGDATRDDLQEAIAFHQVQAETNERKARWLNRVFDAMPKSSKKPVREKLSVEQIDALAVEAE